MDRLARILAALLLLGAMASGPAARAGERPAATVSRAELSDERPIPRRLTDVVDPIKIEHAPARAAFEWWSKTTGIPLLIDWAAMEKEGVDPQTPVSLDLRNIPAGQLLGLIMQQASEEPLIYETTPWYVRVMTKAQARLHLVTRMYDVGDLLHEPLRIDAPPRMDIATALSQSSGSSRGGSSASSSSTTGSLFVTGNSQEKTGAESQQRCEELMKVIRETVEPEIWSENGGPATMHYYRGHLIVRAPLYIQSQIGMSNADSNPSAAKARPEAPGAAKDNAATRPAAPAGKSGN